MNRRESLKSLFAASGTLVALPTWARSWQAEELNVPSSFSLNQQDVLAAVADTIIPAGAVNSIGALSVGVDKFLQKLFDKCYEKEIQDNVKARLMGLETAAIATHGKSFSNCDQVARQELLHKLSVSEDKSDKDFFNLVKSETIRGFNTSREVMVNYLHYKVVPGHYYGCVDVKA